MGWVLGLRQINTWHKVPLQVNFFQITAFICIAFYESYPSTLTLLPSLNQNHASNGQLFTQIKLTKICQSYSTLRSAYDNKTNCIYLFPSFNPLTWLRVVSSEADDQRIGPDLRPAQFSWRRGHGGGWRISELYCDGTVRTIHYSLAGAAQLQASGYFVNVFN